MPAYTTETGPPAGRRQFVIAGALLVLAVILTNLPAPHQQLIASSLRGTVLKPFVLTQESVAGVRVRTTSSDELRVRLDSMIAVLATHYTLSDENRRLRDLLELGERTGPAYRPASVVRSGTVGSESMFHLDVGYEEGVRENAPVVVRSGLLGVVREVRPHSAIGMDWTHPEFRASAMTADGATYGIVETRRGQFREQDRLLFNGTPFHTRLEEGTPVVTSGLGGVFPRGVPMGTVEELAEAEGGWRKAYWLRPATRPGSATHVLVEVEGSGAGPRDLSSAWPADSILHERYVRPREPARRSASILPDTAAPGADTSVTAGSLLARGAEIFRTDTLGAPLVVRLDTATRVGPEGRGGEPAAPPVATPAPARPEPEPEPRTPPEEEGEAGEARDTGQAEQRPVVRNLEEVMDSIRRADTVRADTPRRAPPDTNRAPPDTSPAPPDTNRVASGGGHARLPPPAPGLLATDGSGRASEWWTRRARGPVLPERG